MTTPIIELTQEESERCRFVASEQQRTAVHKGRHRVAMKDGEDALSNSWTGACGEMALAKYLGHPYEGGVCRYKNLPDQSGYDVRTRRKWNYELNIREEDPLDRPWVLVTEIEPKRKYAIRGWIHGSEVTKVPFTSPDGRRKARFVPISMLHPFEVESATPDSTSPDKHWCENMCMLTMRQREMCELMKPLKCPKLKGDAHD